jgi:hypothetical protein
MPPPPACAAMAVAVSQLCIRFMGDGNLPAQASNICNSWLHLPTLGWLLVAGGGVFMAKLTIHKS